MPPRKLDRSALPTKWKPGTATPAGWSFYALWMQCPRSWFLKYYLGLRLMLTGGERNYLQLGTVYHARHQGITPVQIMTAGEPYSTLLPEAERLYQHRVRTGLPDAIGHEVQYTTSKGPLTGIYTCAIDRLEADCGRELKTAGQLNELDNERWHTNGEVVGELVASGLDMVVVDIITKEKLPKVRTVEVRRADVLAQIHVHEQQVANAHAQLVAAVRAADRDIGRGIGDFKWGKAERIWLDNTFPQRIGEGRCTGFGTTCAFFGPCWEGKELSQFTRDEETQRWRKLLL